MSQNLKTVLKLVVSLGLAGAFLWAAFQDVELHTFWRAIRDAQPFWLILSALLLVLSNLPRAWRWLILMAPISRQISLRRAFTALLIGYAANNLLPRAGEVARAVAIKQDQDLPLSGLLATVLVERVLDVLTLLLLFGIILFAFRSDISDAFPWMEGVGLVAFAFTFLLLALFGILSAYGDRVLGPLGRAFGRISQPLADRLTEMLRAFFLGMGSVRSPAGYAEIALSTLLLNGIYLLVVYLVYLSFHFPEQYGLDLATALVVMVISTVGIIIPTPGGTGTYHFFCSQTLYQLYGVPKPQALAFATALHGISYFTLLISGGPGLLNLFWRRKPETRSP